MNLAITVLSLGAALSILVLVHELGHLLAAKRSGVVVEEFGMGFPPRLLTLWRSHGEIVVAGQRIVVPRGFSLPKELPVGSRVVLETTADAKGRKVLSRIEPVAVDEEGAETAAGPGSRVEYLDRGTLYSVNAIPFGGFAKMLGEEDPTSPGSLASKGKQTRIWVLAAGSLMNLAAAVLFFALGYAVGAPAIAEPERVVVGSVAPSSPAEAAGLLPDDVVLQAGGADIPSIVSLQEHIRAHLGVPTTLTVLRGGERLQITVVPRTEWPDTEGPMGVSLSLLTTVKRYPVHQALWAGATQTVSIAAFTLTVPVQIIRGLIPAELARPVGPVGIGQLVGDAVRYSLDTGWWFPVMQMLGALSVALAVTNLLPLPALDGGRILFVIVEAIRGRRIDPAKEGLVHLVGIVLLLAVMLLITWQDVFNPLPSLDWSRLF